MLEDLNLLYGQWARLPFSPEEELIFIILENQHTYPCFEGRHYLSLPRLFI